MLILIFWILAYTVYLSCYTCSLPSVVTFLVWLQTYITLEEATGDPARVQVIYERAVADFPITHDLWLKYTDYVEKNLKVQCSWI